MNKNQMNKMLVSNRSNCNKTGVKSLLLGFMLLGLAGCFYNDPVVGPCVCTGQETGCGQC